MTIFTGAASLIFVILTFTISDLITIPLPFKGYLIGQKYWSGVVIVPIVLFAYLFLGLYTNLIAGIYIEKKTKYLPMITGIGAVLNIITCFALIPVWGITGSAISTLVSYIAMALTMYFVAQKFYHVKYETRKVLAMLFIDVIAIVVFFISFGMMGLTFRIILCVLFGSSIIYISQLYKIKNLLRSNNKNQISNIK
jgi:O-antigen/teichoic acid export membrane protein